FLLPPFNLPLIRNPAKLLDRRFFRCRLFVGDRFFVFVGLFFVLRLFFFVFFAGFVFVLVVTRRSERFPRLGRLVVLRQLDDSRSRFVVNAFDRRQIFVRSVDERIEIVVTGVLELVRPLFRHLFDVVNVRRGTRFGHRFLQHLRERVGDFAFHFFFRLDVDL